MPRKRKPVELPTPLLYTKQQAACALSISERSIDYLIGKGLLEKRMFGSAARVTTASVAKLAETGVPKLEKPAKAEEPKKAEPEPVEKLEKKLRKRQLVPRAAE